MWERLPGAGLGRDPVCADRFDEAGQPLAPDTVSQAFVRRVKRSSVPPIRLHDLRHTSASVALAAGVPAPIVSQRLGHSSIVITIDTYGHMVPGQQEAAAAAMGAAIFGA